MQIRSMVDVKREERSREERKLSERGKSTDESEGCLISSALDQCECFCIPQREEYFRLEGGDRLEIHGVGSEHVDPSPGPSEIPNSLTVIDRDRCTMVKRVRLWNASDKHSSVLPGYHLKFIYPLYTVSNQTKAIPVKYPPSFNNFLFPPPSFNSTSQIPPSSSAIYITPFSQSPTNPIGSCR
jgi:hypothetical protein